MIGLITVQAQHKKEVCYFDIQKNHALIDLSEERGLGCIFYKEIKYICIQKCIKSEVTNIIALLFKNIGENCELKIIQ